MSTDAAGRAAQTLRVALVAPLLYGASTGMDATLAFVAPMLFAILALKMPAAPPLARIVPLALLLVLLPLGIGGLAEALNQYPYMLIGLAGLILFHAFRLQADPRTALVGVLLQTFAILLPIVTSQSERAAGAVSGAFALNGLLAVAGLYLAFALFPGSAPPDLAPPAATADPAPGRTRSAAVSTLVMLPAFTLLFALELTSAMRVLFTIAVVLVSIGRRDARETGAESVLSAVLAGAVALAFGLIETVWPQPAAALLAAALLGLLIVPHAFEGRHSGAVALAVPLVWVLLGTTDDGTLAKTLEWGLYSLAGVLYAIWARQTILACLEWRKDPQRKVARIFNESSKLAAIHVE